jgi:hypothetical protein
MKPRNHADSPIDPFRQPHRTMYGVMPRAYPYPAGLHYEHCMGQEPDCDVVTYGLETTIVSITDSGLDTIRRVLGQQFIEDNIAIRVFVSRKHVPMVEVVEARQALKDLPNMHLTEVTYDLAREMSRSIEPRPIREGR